MDTLETLKKEIRYLAQEQKFLHNEWFVQYHIELAEEIATELCDIYTHANKEMVMVLVWFHDYGKIIDFENQHKATQEKGLEKLLELGFDEEFAKKIIQGVKLIDEKDDLENSSIEVQIASSADGASHLVGPFYLLYWRENHLMQIEDILSENRRKLDIDWNKKIILPEVKEAFKERYVSLGELFNSSLGNYLQKRNVF